VGLCIYNYYRSRGWAYVIGSLNKLNLFPRLNLCYNWVITYKNNTCLQIISGVIWWGYGVVRLKCKSAHLNFYASRESATKYINASMDDA